MAFYIFSKSVCLGQVAVYCVVVCAVLACKSQVIMQFIAYLRHFSIEREGGSLVCYCFCYLSI